MVNWREFERNWLWPTYLGICLEELRRTTENLNRDSRYPGRVSNRLPPEYKTIALYTYLGLIHNAAYFTWGYKWIFSVYPWNCFIDTAEKLHRTLPPKVVMHIRFSAVMMYNEPWLTQGHKLTFHISNEIFYRSCWNSILGDFHQELSANSFSHIDP